jgi:type I restriction enzyme S subunit
MATEYQAYEEYKGTHLGWLSKIPSHWEVKRLKYLGDALIGLTYSPDDVVDEGDGTLVLRSSNVQNKQLAFADNVYVNKKIPEKLLTQKGDILICARNGSRSLIGKNAQIDESAAGMSFGAFMSIFRSPLNDYLSKVFNSPLFEYQSGSFLTATINQLTTGNLNSFEIPLPTKEEREKIVNFLDHETAKIDTLIDKQQQLITLLKEKRQAVISHAVTKGLNPNAPMRDSGVKWLGKVPEHWVKSSLGFECSVKARLGWKGLKADEYVNEGFIFLATPNIKSNEIDFENVNYITEERYEESPEIMLEIGDVLVTKDGSTTGTTNLVRNLPAPTTVNSSIAVIRSIGRLESFYLYYFFVTTYTQNIIKYMQGGMGVPHLFQADLKKFTVLMPPSKEQSAIAVYIEARLPKFDLLIERANQEVHLLQERRTALISAAVTGKIDVRNWQAPVASNNNKEVAV